jgi:hypothetical protein
MFRQQRDIDLGNYRVSISHDAGIKVFTGGQHSQKILTDFLLDGAGLPTRGNEFMEIGGFGLSHDSHQKWVSGLKNERRKKRSHIIRHIRGKVMVGVLPSKTAKKKPIAARLANHFRLRAERTFGLIRCVQRAAQFQ